ncbi:MAG: hypothetical protein JNM62_09250 [Flavobacteriales bacterium]|nr:hypothetical protein [Flavobacteriales bacterium]
MHKLERILWVIVGIGAVLKVFHVPLNGLLLILSLSTLSMLYFFASWALFPQPARKDQVVLLSVLAGAAFSIAITGILFKIQLWPFSGFYLLAGMVALLGIFVALVVLGTRRPDLAAYRSGMLRRVLPLLLACALFNALPSGTLTAFYYRDDPEMAPLMVRYTTTNDPSERAYLQLRMDSIQQQRDQLR